MTCLKQLLANVTANEAIGACNKNMLAHNIDSVFLKFIDTPQVRCILTASR